MSKSISKKRVRWFRLRGGFCEGSIAVRYDCKSKTFSVLDKTGKMVSRCHWYAGDIINIDTPGHDWNRSIEELKRKPKVKARN
jgi:hypothetical protein